MIQINNYVIVIDRIKCIEEIGNYVRVIFNDDKYIEVTGKLKDIEVLDFE